MNSSVRTFIAIKIIPEKKLLEVLAHIRAECSDEAIKWVKPDNLHITLKFLGDTSAKQVEKIKKQLETIVENFKPFQGVLKGVGYFKTKSQPRILFANIYDAEQLNEIVEGIESKISTLGFAAEQRSFKPHLTLARIKFLKNRKAFYHLIDNYYNAEFQVVPVTELIFFQSKLNSDGPEYQPLQIAKFKG